MTGPPEARTFGGSDEERRDLALPRPAGPAGRPGPGGPATTPGDRRGARAGRRGDAPIRRPRSSRSWIRRSASSTARSRSTRRPPPRRRRPPARRSPARTASRCARPTATSCSRSAATPSSTAASGSTTRRSRRPRPSCCAACGRSSRGPSTRSSTSASCPTSAPAPTVLQDAYIEGALQPRLPRPRRQVQAAGGPRAPAVGHRHPVRRARPADQPGAQPRPRHPDRRRCRRRRGELCRSASSTAWSTSATATPTPTTTRTWRAASSSSRSSRATGPLKNLGFGIAASQGDQNGTPTATEPAVLPHARTADLLLLPLGRDRRGHHGRRRHPHPALPPGVLLQRTVRPARRVRDLAPGRAPRPRLRHPGAQVLAGWRGPG